MMTAGNSHFSQMSLTFLFDSAIEQAKSFDNNSKLKFDSLR